MENNNNSNNVNDKNKEVNELAMKNIKKNLDGVISGYLEQFTKKFETFMGQMRIADILLKSFEYRYDKIQGKIGNINDVLSYDYQKHSIFNQRCSDLAGLEVKMSTIEQKLGLIEQKIDGLIDLTQKRKLAEERQKEKIINAEDTTEKKQDIKIEENIKIEELKKNENK